MFNNYNTKNYNNYFNKNVKNNNNTAQIKLYLNTNYLVAAWRELPNFRLLLASEFLLPPLFSFL